MNGYCRPGLARQHYPQVHWVISFFNLSLQLFNFGSHSSVKCDFALTGRLEVSVCSQRLLTHPDLPQDHRSLFVKGEGNAPRT